MLNVDQRMTNDRDTLVHGPLFATYLYGAEHKYSWNYRSAVGMLGYLQNSSRPDICMDVQQCARFNNCPKLCHEQAIMRIGSVRRSATHR